MNATQQAAWTYHAEHQTLRNQANITRYQPDDGGGL